MTNSLKTACAAALATLACSALAGANTVTLSFDDLPSGATLSTQYEGQGVVFQPNAFTGSGSSSSGAAWATNTDLAVVAIASISDEAGMAPSLFASGKVLRDPEAWLDHENGDPSFAAIFSSPVLRFSVSFAAVDTAGGAVADTRIFAYNGDLLLGIVTGDTQSPQPEFTLSFAAPAITRVVIAPGSYNDWVAVDNLSFTSAVPEPSPMALLMAGIGAICLLRRRTHAQALGR